MGRARRPLLRARGYGSGQLSAYGETLILGDLFGAAELMILCIYAIMGAIIGRYYGRYYGGAIMGAFWGSAEKSS